MRFRYMRLLRFGGMLAASVSGVLNETFTPANSSATCKSGNVTYSATK